MTIETDNILVQNETVIAETISRVRQSSLTMLENNTHWYWQRFKNTGTVVTDAYEIGSDKHLAQSTERQAIQWYIDNRPWKRYLSTDPYGKILFGSKTELIQEVTKGAVLR